MGEFIEVKDHRGLKIFCTKSQWDNHIVSPTGHPIMKNNIPAIIETIKNPDYIGESHDSKPPLNYREVYCKDVEFATYHSKNPITKVVVNIVGGSGEIITAFDASNLTKGTTRKIYSADETD